MSSEPITALPQGTLNGSNVTVAVDIYDTSEDASGTTKKYPAWQEFNLVLKGLGATTYTAVLAASTTAFTATYNNGSFGVGATLTNAGTQTIFAIDGVTPAAGDRILIKDQAASAQNGIYTVTNTGSSATNWILTRATDFDTSAEIITNAVIYTNLGTINGGLSWYVTSSQPYTIGTTAITFAEFTLAGFQQPLSWINVTATSQAMTQNNKYVANNAGLVTFTLPTTSTFGTILQVGGGIGGGGWKIAQNAGQQIILNNSGSTLGATGYVASTAAHDSISLYCANANTTWIAYASLGAITIF